MHYFKLLTSFILFLCYFQINVCAEIDYKISGWSLIKKSDALPEDVDHSEHYLKFENNTEINLINPVETSAKRKYTGMEISFRFWAKWDSEVDYRNIFELSVLPCNSSYPNTRFIENIDNGAKEWKEFSYAADNGKDNEEKFNFNSQTCRDNFRIVFNKKQPEVNLLLAIKELKINYSYDLVNGNTEKPETEKRECINPTECKDFRLESDKVYWSVAGPAFENGLDEYYMPRTENDKLTFTIKPNINVEEEVCLKLNYYVTKNSLLHVSFNDGKSDLQLTTTVSDDGKVTPPEWYEYKFCFSDFIRITEMDTINVLLTAEIKDYSLLKDTIAIYGKPEIVKDHKNKPDENNLKQYLKYWNHLKESDGKWLNIPNKFWTNLKEKNKPYSPKFEISPTSESSGRSYLISNWFGYAHDLVFNFEVDYYLPEKTVVNITVMVFSDESESIFAQDYELINSETNLKKTIKEIKRPYPKVDSAHYLVFRIDYKYNGQEKPAKPIKIQLKEVDLSDGCRDENCSERGVCSQTLANEFKCDCQPGFIHERCDKVDYCVYRHIDKSGKTHLPNEKQQNDWINGETSCKKKSALCENSLSDNRFFCKCREDHYWDFKEEKCIKLNSCDGIVCPNEGEICDEKSSDTNKQCKCDDNRYKTKNETNECIERDQCEETTKPENVKCIAYKGKYHLYCDGIGYTNEVKKNCTPVLERCSPLMKDILGCDQQCTIKDDKYECSCFDGYYLENDEKTCKKNFTAGANCKENQIAVKDGKCECKFGFSENCKINYCQLNLRDSKIEIDAICGKDGCEYKDNRFQCKCSGMYEVDKDGTCKLKTPCSNNPCEGGQICIPDITTSNSTYRCECPISKVFNGTTCVDQCQMDNENCLYRSNSVCKANYEKRGGSSSCACQAGFVKGDQEYCYLSEYTRKVHLVTKLNNKVKSYFTSKRRRRAVDFQCEDLPKPDQRAECFKYLIEMEKEINKNDLQTENKRIEEYLHMQIEQSLKPVMNEYLQTITIINSEYDSKTKEYSMELSLQFNKKFKHIDLHEKLTASSVCIERKSELMKGYCFIPPYLVVKHGSIAVEEMKYCEKKDEYCTAHSICEKKDNYFSCKCKSGFKIDHIIQLKSPQDKKYTKQLCSNLNQCKDKDICGPGATCKETMGSFECVCNPGFQKVNGICQNLCNDVIKCENGGVCELAHGNATGHCVCKDGWKGAKCEVEDEKVKSGKTTLIVVSVVLSVLLFLVLVIAIFFFKKSNEQNALTETRNGQARHTQSNF